MRPITVPSYNQHFFPKIFFPRSYEAEYRANNSVPPTGSEAPQSPLSKTNMSDHAGSYHHHHQSTSTHLRSKSKSTLATMAKELKRTPVKQVLSRFRVRMPVPQALRRKTSQLTMASDVHPFNYPNEPSLECGWSSASPPLSAARSGNKTYLLTDSPILEAAKELSGNDDVELFVLDGTGSDGIDGGVVYSKTTRVSTKHRPRHQNRKAGSSSPPPPRYDAGTSRPPAVRGAEGWTKRKGPGPELVRVEAPHFVDPDAILSLPHMPYSSTSADSRLVSSDASSPLRDEKHHRDRPRAYPFAGDGSSSRHRRSNVPQTPCTCSSGLSRLTSANLKEHNHRMSKLNPLVLSFSSPLGMNNHLPFLGAVLTLMIFFLQFFISKMSLDETLLQKLHNPYGYRCR